MGSADLSGNDICAFLDSFLLETVVDHASHDRFTLNFEWGWPVSAALVLLSDDNYGPVLMMTDSWRLTEAVTLPNTQWNVASARLNRSGATRDRVRTNLILHHHTTETFALGRQFRLLVQKDVPKCQ
jgi:hypothetical protein